MSYSGVGEDEAGKEDEAGNAVALSTCLSAALKLCNKSFPNPAARVCKPRSWLEVRIAWHQGPKGRSRRAGSRG